MTKKSEQIITTMLNVDPIMIDSALVSAQTRKRLYWTNIEGIVQPEDRGKRLDDIIQFEEVDEKYYLSETALARVERRHPNYRPKINPEKASTINLKNNSGQLSMDNGTTLIAVVNARGKFRQIHKSLCIDANYFKGMDNHAQRPMILHPDMRVRRLTPIEVERLQGLPDDYTAMVSDTQRYKACGNGWQADTVAYILSFLD